MQGEEIMMHIRDMIRLHGNRFITLIWASAVLIVIVFAVVGFFNNESVAYIFFSLFPVALLADISIIISFVAERNSYAKAAWLLLTWSIFIFALCVSIVDPIKSAIYLSAGILIIYPMLVLSFPSSIIWIYLYGGVSYLLDMSDFSTSIGSHWLSVFLANFILWMGFVTIGYLQWFKLLPFVINRIKLLNIFNKEKTNYNI